jgi:hypothetical protein
VTTRKSVGHDVTDLMEVPKTEQEIRPVVKREQDGIRKRAEKLDYTLDRSRERERASLDVDDHTAK